MTNHQGGLKIYARAHSGILPRHDVGGGIPSHTKLMPDPDLEKIDVSRRKVVTINTSPLFVRRISSLKMKF
jgi:hypothetical protein